MFWFINYVEVNYVIRVKKGKRGLNVVKIIFCVLFEIWKSIDFI